MSPEGDRILGLSVQRLAMELGPMLTTAFAQGQLNLTGFMLTLVANEYERGAELRASENAGMRKLFADISPAIQDATLRRKLEAAATSKDASLRISELDKGNWDLRRLMIEAQTHLESLSGDAARAADRQVWAMLREIADKRMVKLGG
jgi:hypothetical protein